ncbi:GNAT family N-acetyltransferase [Actinomadura rubrisoli]|uniref:N-acetyltransferase n=1 Tax=Actinomadura rubrisoli TaxID=2530368 RepID=A0A4R5C5W9_9ACTN|nr:GNAT family N-acetyltransferase [Actinomadura rubrisoli]TDD94069.1 N-acetyltransferase [Actinomadura rubrisoli]
MSNEITDNAERARYEIKVDGALAGFADYESRPGRLVLTHTEVDDAFEGKGIGSALARGALDDIRAKDLRVVPRCPFIKKWIDKHPDYQDLVAT